MNEFTAWCDAIPGWAWLLCLVVGMALAFLTPVATFGWRTLYGATVYYEPVEVLREVVVPAQTLWSAETDYRGLPEPGRCPADTSTDYLDRIYGHTGQPQAQPTPATPARVLTVTTILGDPRCPGLPARVLTGVCQVRP